jgi:hypothetical protein
LAGDFHAGEKGRDGITGFFGGEGEGKGKGIFDGITELTKFLGREDIGFFGSVVINGG